MQIMRMGLNRAGRALFEPLEAAELTQRLVGALDGNAERLRRLSAAGSRGGLSR
jgi:hypothetical protein